MTVENPGVVTRVRIALPHMAKVLFLRWPGYDFNDLAAIQDCLDGPAFQRAADRIAAHPDGQRLLAERPDLGIKTVDWDHLSRLPIDTFGYNIWHHFYANDIMIDWELDPPHVTFSDEAEYAKSRYRATHDVRHVLMGCGVEGFEEVVLLTFQHAQLRQKLAALISLFGGFKHMIIDGKWREIWTGWRRAWRIGHETPFLLTMPIEELYEVPLDEVRRRYGIEAIRSVYPVDQRHPDSVARLAEAS